MQLFEATQEFPVICRFGRGSPNVVAGANVVADVLLALDPQSLYLPVPSHLDGPAFVVTTLARQVGPDAADAVAGAMHASPMPRDWFDALLPKLHGRRLVVDRRPIVRSDATNEISSVIRGSWGWLKELLKLPAIELRGGWTTKSAPLPPLVRPRAVGIWDAERVWAAVEHDPERYALAAAHEMLVGPMPAGAVLRNTHRLAQTLWSGLSAEHRELIALLWVHDRPVARTDLDQLQLVDRGTLETGLESNLIDERRGYLAPLDGLGSLRLLESPGAARDRHQRWAEAYERAIWASNIDSAVAVLEAHRHYAAVPLPSDALRLARFGMPIVMEMAVEMSHSGRWREAADVYQSLGAILDDAGLGPAAARRMRAYVTHYLHYNRYKSNLEPLDETAKGYERALEQWPDNALFLSRQVRALIHDRREPEALERFEAAWGAVPSKAESCKYLLARTIRRLLERRFVVPAVALLSRVPRGIPTEHERRILEMALERGWKTKRLWAPSLQPVELPQPIHCQAWTHENHWKARFGEAEAVADSAFEAVTRATRSAMFHHFASAWLKGTGHLASRKRAFEHPQYVAIINLGAEVVPDILAWIRDGKGGHWDAALAALTGEQPQLPPGDVTLTQVAQAWLRWGSARGLLSSS
ncbi:MAG: hypothetical protein HOW73_18145 [Polyangiaceae bacterium]|nr:hypothetical protein [Polyangiaceae bacterium]